VRRLYHNPLREGIGNLSQGAIKKRASAAGEQAGKGESGGQPQ
jgi:hypothetical protein